MADAKSELAELARLGALPVKNSGRGRVKGDGLLLTNDDDPESAIFTVDVKEFAKSFGVSLTTWTKIQSDAKKNLTQPMLKIVLGPEDGPRIRTVCISEEMFLEMWEVYKNAG